MERETDRDDEYCNTGIHRDTEGTNHQLAWPWSVLLDPLEYLEGWGWGRAMLEGPYSALLCHFSLDIYNWRKPLREGGRARSFDGGQV